jgi:DNA replication and repair protein RecF
VVARDFRNLRSVDVQLPPEGVRLLGENGHGKTNFLELVRYFTILRSPRRANDGDLVCHGESGFFISTTARASGERTISVGFDAVRKEKKVSLDGVEVSRLSDAFGSVMATLLSPTDSRLITGGPSERRRYLDVLLSLSDPHYLAALQRYRAALLRRNAVLRERARNMIDDEALAVWEPLLAETGAFLWQRRTEWCSDVAPELARLCGTMGEGAAVTLALGQHGSAGARDAHSLMEALHNNRPRDVRRGITSVGPHRDDLQVLLDGHEIRAFGSGGQQHTVALALRLLEAFTVTRSQRRRPVLLLDDPFAELDEKRSDRILGLLDDSGYGQVIIAVPRASDVPSAFNRLPRWRMAGGAIQEHAA